MRMESENYVYKKEIDWSTLMEGFTLPLDNQVIFLQNMENFLQRGQSKIIHFFMNGKTYDAKIVNVNNSVEKRKKDAYQIRYPRNGELSQVLQQYFFKSMSYIKMIRESRDPKDRSYIKLPDGLKEYLAIYTTEYEDTFLLEPIVQDDFQVMKKAIQGMRERTVENEIEYEMEDKSSGIEKRLQIVKIRKLNRKIGENLKLLYGYRCQICGQVIGEKYGSHIAEAHHIDYFVNSLNNDANNQMIVCPNHHSVTVIERHVSTIKSGTEAERYDSVMTVANNIKKGWYATLLAETIDARAVIPMYILDAIVFAAKDILSEKLLWKMVQYSFEQYLPDSDFDDLKAAFKEAKSSKEIQTTIKEFCAEFPEDMVSLFIAKAGGLNV